MNVPSIWSLNFRTLDWLNAEANTWFGTMAKASGQDKADAKAYLDAVIAERNQRLASYSGGWWSTITAGISAPFEAMGGSGGAGAAGLAGGIADAAKIAADKATGIGANIVAVAAVAVAVGVAFYLSRGGRA